MKRNTLAMVTGVLLLAAGTLQAAPKDELFEGGKPLAQQLPRIEAQLNDGETYSELKLEDRSRVREALGRMRGALERFPDEGSLSASTKAELYNDQEVVNTILTQAREDSRLICRREKPIGSNRSVTQCTTVAERARQKERAQRDLGTAQRVGKFVN